MGAHDGQEALRSFSKPEHCFDVSTARRSSNASIDQARPSSAIQSACKSAHGRASSTVALSSGDASRHHHLEPQSIANTGPGATNAISIDPPCPRVEAMNPSDECGNTSQSLEDAAVSDNDVLRGLLDGSDDKAILRNFKHFDEADLHPPISRFSLAELDIKKVANNPQFRSDVNFEPELKVRPHDKGRQAETRQAQLDAYWWAITVESELYVMLRRMAATAQYEPETSGQRLGKLAAASRKRMPNMFGAIDEIVSLLLPAEDAAIARDALDVPLIMQQISKGEFDLVAKATWLSQLLKKHCAPMRDKLFESMMVELSKRDSRSIASGLRQLFLILEAMQLDLLNHKIRTYRPRLIQETTNFIFKFQTKRMINKYMQQEIDVEWFKHHRQRLQIQPADCLGSSETGTFDVFIHAFLELVLPSDPWPIIPESFVLDTNRIHDLRLYILENVYAELSFEVFEECYEMITTTPCTEPSTFATKMKSDFRLLMARRRVHTAMPYLAIQIVSQIEYLVGLDSDQHMATLLEHVQCILDERFCFASPQFVTHRNMVQQFLLNHVSAICQRLMRATPWELYTALVPNACAASPDSEQRLSAVPLASSAIGDATAAQLAVHETTAKRMAHMAILHHRVWAPLIYDHI